MRGYIYFCERQHNFVLAWLNKTRFSFSFLLSGSFRVCSLLSTCPSYHTFSRSFCSSIFITLFEKAFLDLRLFLDDLKNVQRTEKINLELVWKFLFCDRS